MEYTAAQTKNLPAMQETQVRSLGWEDFLEKEMATHSSIFAWRIPWTEEPDRLQSIGSQRVGHDWATKTCTPLHVLLSNTSHTSLNASCSPPSDGQKLYQLQKNLSNLGKNCRNVGCLFCPDMPEGVLPRWLRGKDLTCQCRKRRRWGFHPWVGETP